MNKQKALIFCKYQGTFVQKDIDIMSSQFEVEVHDFYSRHKWASVFMFFSQTIFMLRYIWGADLLICIFAGYHSMLPVIFGKFFRKPSLVIVGGTDAHYFPAIGYGNWQKKMLGFVTKLSFMWCTRIAPKHRSLMFSEYTYDKNEPSRQGIYARMPKSKIPFTEITNGYDPAIWFCQAEKVKNTFITVCGGWEYPFQQQLKGIDLIVGVAPLFPECEFIIQGVPDASVLKVNSPNINILPPAKSAELIKILSGCEFYLQLSMAEGFPNALCEAMLCECIPIGSSVFSIPEIIGDTGFILKERDAAQLSDLIKMALLCDKETLSKNARTKIAANYTLESRKQKLLELCTQLAKGIDVRQSKNKPEM